MDFNPNQCLAMSKANLLDKLGDRDSTKGCCVKGRGIKTNQLISTKKTNR